MTRLGPTQHCSYSDRRHLGALVAKVCRRKVLFKDDCELVNGYFLTVGSCVSIIYVQNHEA